VSIIIKAFEYFDMAVIRIVASPIRHLTNMHDNVKIGKPGKKLNVITTGDLDADGKLYPDYKERRAKRKAEEEKKNEAGGFVGPDWR